MKVGILTFHNALNYGAVLQTFALQRFINDEYPMVRAETINYSSPAIKETKGYKKMLSGSLIGIPFKLLNRWLKRRVFRRFSRENILLSSVEYSTETILNAASEYDLLFVGSDQVWNPLITHHDMNYFLQFVDSSKRYSYAASIGISKWPDEYEDEILSLLQTFQKVSVREKTSLDYLRNLRLNDGVFSHVDPTLLLSKDTWKTIADNRDEKKQYVFVYMIHPSMELIEKAKKYAQEHFLEVVYVGPYLAVSGIRFLPSPSVNRVIGLFKNATCTFVNSYHGTILSVLFHKPFFVAMQYRDGRNNRISDLLELFGPESMCFDQSEEVIRSIKWDKVDAVIAREISCARQYFDSIFNNP